jgi:hypothetical protein
MIEQLLIRRIGMKHPLWVIAIVPLVLAATYVARQSPPRLLCPFGLLRHEDLYQLPLGGAI